MRRRFTLALVLPCLLLCAPALTWSQLTTLNPSGPSGGTVSATGTPTTGQAAEWTSATVVQGVAVTGTGSYAKSVAPTLSGPINVLGPTNATQFTINANVSQTAPLIVLKDSSGLELLRLHNNSTLRSNVYLGYIAGINTDPTTSENTFIGYNSGSSNTLGTVNTAVGGNSFVANTTGNYNAAFGAGALFRNTTGIYNTAVGMHSLLANTEGTYNNAVGGYSAYQITTGSFNHAFGWGALGSNLTGNANIGIGYATLFVATNSNNVAIGDQSGNVLTTGTNNLILGHQVAKTVLTTGSRNILIGTSSAITTAAAGTNDSLNIGGTLFGDLASNFLFIKSIAAPGSPASGFLNLWEDSTDLRFHDKNAAGTIGTTVVADTGASNNFLTAISAAGVISKARPSAASLSDTATTGNVLRGNGTSFVSATLAASDLSNGVIGSGAVMLQSTPVFLGSMQLTVASGLNGLSIRNTLNGGGDYGYLDIWQAGAIKAQLYTNSNNLTIIANAGSVVFSGTGDASSPTTGNLQNAGGMGIAKKLYVGTNVDAATYSVSGAAGVTGTATVCKDATCTGAGQCTIITTAGIRTGGTC